MCIKHTYVERKTKGFSAILRCSKVQNLRRPTVIACLAIAFLYPPTKLTKGPHSEIAPGPGFAFGGPGGKL